eukprot:TRINITY_DN22495_c0_g2_i1.p1 TRINITY_DN22495_c0_g2~~TRINITY_DN22495_c0_g2_i1.p1  ORF type:complete len:317 (-),score=34.73 TRINITY_DN22495_c0_g2_i1:109-1059(-)
MCIRDRYMGTKSIDRSGVSSVQPVNSGVKESSRRQKYAREVALLQKVKKQQRQNAVLDFDCCNAFYSENPDRFHHKRFKMNPRFTWLYKVEEDADDWIHSINSAISKSLDIPSAQTKLRKLSHNRPEHKRMFRSVKADYGLAEGGKLQPLNLSDVVFDSPYREYSISNQKGGEYSAKQKRFTWSKNKGVSCTRPGGDKQPLSDLTVAPANPPANFILPKGYPNNADTLKKRSLFIRTNKNWIKRREKLVKTSHEKAKDSFNGLGLLDESRNKNYNYEILMQGKLVKHSKKRCKIYIENDPIFDLNSAVRSHKTKLL